MELLRSLIFVPGNRANMLERALNFDADIIMVDLEDSVPPGEKVAARAVAAEWIPRLRQAGQRVMVRVNSLDTGLTRDEIAALISPHLYGVSVGKTESAEDLRAIEGIISPLEIGANLEAGHVNLIPWIESARAIVNVNEMAAALVRTVAIAFGAEDYTNDMGIQRTDNGEEVYHARSTVAIAARAAGIASLDSPYVAFRNPEGLRKDAGAARQMGYTGKFAIHPAQVETINEVFSPNPEDVAYARRVMEAWQEAEANGRGSLSLDDKMVDVPVVKRAQNLLAQVDEIEKQLAARGRD
ncbi:MAG: CoA ester lyase [Chloroflexota bacterium]|nr:CoA ester lyase [Chloroflexota bacterium]